MMAPLDCLTLPAWGWHLEDIEVDQKLMMSLQQYGQLSPVLVYEDDGRMIVCDGRRRVTCLRVLGATEVEVKSLGVLTESEVMQRMMSLELRGDMDWAALSKHVTTLSQTMDVKELGSTTPWPSERFTYFLRLYNFDWSTYTEHAQGSLLDEEDDDAPDMKSLTDLINEGVDHLNENRAAPGQTTTSLRQQRAAASVKETPVRVPRETIRETVRETVSAAHRLSQVLSFSHAPSSVLTPSVAVVDRPGPAPVQETRSLAPSRPVLPAFVSVKGHERPVSSWTPKEPPTLDGITEVQLDTEGTGLKWYAGDRPIGISIGYGDRTQYLPWGHRGGGNLDEVTVRRWAERELRGKHIVGANIRYDLHMLREWGVDLEAQGCTFSDVQHQAALLNEYRHTFNLPDLMSEFLPNLRKTSEDSEGDIIDKERMADYHAGDVARYAEIDVLGVRQLRDVFQVKIADEDLGAVLALENAVIPVVVEMEKNAALINRPLLKKWVTESHDLLGQYFKELARELGFAMNPDKNDHWQRLFEKCGIPVTHYTELHSPSFTDEVLALIDHPAVQLARRAGKLSSLRSKFLEAYDAVVGDDSKLRFSLHQLRGDEYGTIRGRFSMSGGGKHEPRFGANLQQVFSVERQREAFGIDGKDDTQDDKIFLIRRLFVAGPDEDGFPGVYLNADAQSIEYRLAAHFASSKQLLEAYEADWQKIRDPKLIDGKWVDFHRVVQDIITPHKPVGRKTTKNLNFLKIYGGGRDKAAQTLGLSRPETDQIIDLYDSMFPEFKELLNKASKLARERGYVKTILGRRARFPNKEFTHAALNYVIQGSAADIMKKKLVELHAERSHTGFVMRQTVHDEVDGDATLPETEDRVREILNRQSFETRAPIVWTVKLGPTWAACE